MLLISGCHKLPESNVYWEMLPDTFAQTMSDSMPRNTFERAL